MYSIICLTLVTSSETLSGICTLNSSSTCISTSVTSKLSNFRSFVKWASTVTFRGSTLSNPLSRFKILVLTLSLGNARNRLPKLIILNDPCNKIPIKMNLFQDSAGPSSYIDRQFKGSPEEYKELIMRTTTCYVGNVSFYTSEEQLYTFFGQAGGIKVIIMGLDRVKKTPCGFCFVEFSSRAAAERAVRYLNRLKLDDQLIRVDLDYGFADGRQFGRGKSGGQVYSFNLG
eukprot:NODE_262_length_12566_cov_0.133392.p6 type:complete len:230 gc:universal NODE_262_length_12566_cov_0.133392:7702-7013(-)